jgi:hypothetical protein
MLFDAPSGDVVTHKFPGLYKCAVSFMLAYPYGFTRVMSSYFFGEDSSLGPPADDDYKYVLVTQSSTLSKNLQKKVLSKTAAFFFLGDRCHFQGHVS